MTISQYIGFDVHKKSINFCVKTGGGAIVEEGRLRATRDVLREWAEKRTEPWHGAMEATLFSGWIYDTLEPYAAKLEMGHPAMMKAIGASKKKNDRLDARKTCDLVRCDLLPSCYVAPVEIRDLRRMMRYRNVVVEQATRTKNKMSGLLMEVGAEYNKKQLHGKKYFTELLGTLEEVPESVKELLQMSRGALEMFEATQEQLVRKLEKHPRQLAAVHEKELKAGGGDRNRANAGGCAEAGGLSVGGGQKRQAVRGAACSGRESGGRESGVRKCSEITRAGGSRHEKTATGRLSPHGPIRLFPGRPVHPNSDFEDGPELFPQVDVWSRYPVGPIRNGLQKADRGIVRWTGKSASEKPSIKCREACVFP